MWLYADPPPNIDRVRSTGSNEILRSDPTSRQKHRQRYCSSSSSRNVKASSIGETTPLLGQGPVEETGSSVEETGSSVEETGPSVEETTQSARLDPGEESMRREFCSRRCISATVYVASLISLTATSLILKVDFEEHSDERTITAPYILYQISQISVVTLGVIFASLGLWATYGSNSRPDSKHSSKVEVTLLVTALAGLYVAQCLHLYASLHTDYVSQELQLRTTPTCNTMWFLSIVESFLTGVLACIQTLFIVQSLTMEDSLTKKQRQIEPAKNSQTQTEPRKDSATLTESATDSLTQTALDSPTRTNCQVPSKKDVLAAAAVTILLCNGILWGCKTYELSGYYCNPMYFNFYSSMWVQLSDIFYPLWIFFHFHSAVSCGDILLETLKR